MLCCFHNIYFSLFLASKFRIKRIIRSFCFGSLSAINSARATSPLALMPDCSRRLFSRRKIRKRKEPIRLLPSLKGWSAFLCQTSLVDGVPLDKVVFELGSGPDPKLGAAHRFHSIADRNDSVEIITIKYSCDVTLPFFLNYPEFPDS